MDDNKLWGSSEAFWAVYIAITVVGGILCGIAIQRMVHRRRSKLTEFAARYGFRYSPYTRQHHERYAGVAYFNRGDRRSRRSANLVWGRREGIDWAVFDYWNNSEGCETNPRGGFGVVAANLPGSFPMTRIRQGSSLDKIASLAGMSDIRFESDEFGRKYHVTSADRKFAYDLIHPRMMEYLLSAPAVDWQLGGHTILTVRPSRYPSDELLGAMRLIEGFIERIPHYVRQDRGAV